MFCTRFYTLLGISEVVVIEIVISVDLSGIVAISRLDFWQIVIDGIEGQAVTSAPLYCFIQQLSITHCPQDKLDSLLVLDDQPINHRLVSLAYPWPSVRAQCPIKVNRYDHRQRGRFCLLLLLRWWFWCNHLDKTSYRHHSILVTETCVFCPSCTIGKRHDSGRSGTLLDFPCRAFYALSRVL